MTDERTSTKRASSLREVMADAQEVALHWRAAHADLLDVASGDAEADRLRIEMQHLRAEYARLIEEARRSVDDIDVGDVPLSPLDA